MQCKDLKRGRYARPEKSMLWVFGPYHFAMSTVKQVFSWNQNYSGPNLLRRWHIKFNLTILCLWTDFQNCFFRRKLAMRTTYAMGLFMHLVKLKSSWLFIHDYGLRCPPGEVGVPKSFNYRLHESRLVSIVVNIYNCSLNMYLYTLPRAEQSDFFIWACSNNPVPKLAQRSSRAKCVLSHYWPTTLLFVNGFSKFFFVLNAVLV